ncbi:hypothetical protein G9E11_06135 [Arthrobacter sp. IA7]|nr:hypothetical protein [Arthrobacter ipis]MBD1541833.1 hypothetical protein [Arthrobacter ipis]
MDLTTPRATIQGWIDTAESEKSWLVIAYQAIGMNIGQIEFNTATAD